MKTDPIGRTVLLTNVASAFSGTRGTIVRPTEPPATDRDRPGKWFVVQLHQPNGKPGSSSYYDCCPVHHLTVRLGDHFILTKPVKN